MTEPKDKDPHDKRERRTKMRLSDVHRLVDEVLPIHMPEHAETPGTKQAEPEDKSRKRGRTEHGKQD